MRIARVKLVNFRCHARFEETFPAGINLLLGKNGSGKTSVLEAIGIVLYGDTGKHRTLEAAVGPEKKSADIEVEFQARDGARWLVRRRIGAGSRSNQLFIHAGGEWQPTDAAQLLGLFGLEKDGAEAVFRSMIIAEQNTFTRPFLETSADRTTIFDRVFGISQWRELGSRTDLEEPFKKAVSDLEGAQRVLVEECERADLEGIGRDEAAISQEIARLDAAGLVLDACETSVDSHIKALRALSAAEAESDRSREILDQSLRRRKVMETDRAWLDLHRDDLARLARLEEGLPLSRSCREAVSSLGLVAARLRERETRIADASQEYQRIGDEKKGLEAEFGHQGAARASIAPSLVGLDRAWEERNSAASQSLQARSALEALAKTGATITALEAKRERLLVSQAQLEALQDERDRLVREKEDAAARYRALVEQKTSLSEGHCPLLGEVCQNLAGRGTDAPDEISHLLQQFSETTKTTSARLNLIDQEIAGFKQIAVEVGAVTAAIEAAGEEASKRAIREEAVAVAIKREAATQTSFESAAELLLGLAQDHPWQLRLAAALPEGFAPAGVHDFAASQVLRDASHHALASWESDLRSMQTRLTRLADDEASRLTKIAALEKEAALARQELTTAQAESQAASLGWETWRKGDAEFPKLTGLEEMTALTRAEESLRTALAPLAELANEAAACRGRLAEADLILADCTSAETRQAAALEASKIAQTACTKTADLVRAALVKASLPEISAEDLLEIEQAESLRGQVSRLSSEMVAARAQARTRLEAVTARRAEAVRLQERLATCESSLSEARRRHDLVQRLRSLLKELGPYITQHALPQIAREATVHYRNITGRSERILWTHDERESYAVSLAESQGDGGARSFANLSGGEQVAVALSLRAALVEALSASGFVIFDEPTINLDADARHNLATAFKGIFGRIEQAFVITHDDSFEAMADNEVRCERA